MKRPKVGLALGGGGARGISHIGVLKVFEKYDIPIDCIAGTSIGAIIGGSYAVHKDAERVEQIVRSFVDSEAYEKSGLQLLTMNEPAENFWGQVAKSVRERIVINLAQSRSSMVNGVRLQNIINFVLEDIRIEKTQIPLAVVATDLKDGHEVIFQYGSLRTAALASAAVPGFLPPVDYLGHTLVDGAVTSPVPVEAVFGIGADVVIAVDVGQDLDMEAQNLNLIDIIFRSSTITVNKLRDHIIRKADTVIRPEVGAVHWADFSDITSLVEAGQQAAEARIDEIFDCLHDAKPFWQRFWRRSPRAVAVNGVPLVK